MKLTEAAVRRLPAPDPSGKQRLYWADEPKGFGVLCSGVSNARSFILQRAVNGKTRRITIAPVVGVAGELEAARAKARQKLADFFYRGIDPKDEVAAGTLRIALEVYLASRSLRPRTIANYRDAVERSLAPWLDVPLRDITPAMVLRRHAEIDERGGGANGTMRVLRAVYNHAAYLAADAMPPNPVRLRGAWRPEPPRTGHVGPADLPAFYRAVMALESPIGRDLILLLLFTGFRRREATALRWDNVDFTECVIRLPAKSTKANRALDLPMSDVVRDILVARRAVGDAGGWVFPAATSRSGHIEEPRFFLEQVAVASGVRVSVHDLRRTHISIAESTEMSVFALKALVNHSLGRDVTANYIQVNADRLRAPVQRVADEIKRLCEIESPAGVINIKKVNV
jgi:integrase